MDKTLERFLTAAQGGSAGGVQVRDAELHLDAIPEAVWFTAEADGEFVGAYALVPVEWGWWRCHLTVRSPEPEVVTRRLVLAARDHAGDTPIAGACETSHVVLRGVPEEVGFDVVAETGMLIWSRKQRSAHVRQARADDRDVIHRHLAARGVHRVETVSAERFWVLDRNGIVVAGAALQPLAWFVDSLGPGSQVLLPALRMSGLDLQPLRFGAFHGVFGEPDDLAELFAGVLQSAGIPVALLGADITDPRWAVWTKLRRGMLGRLLGIHSALVYGAQPVPRPLDWTTAFLR